MSESQYAQAGVDIDAGHEAVNLMKQAVQATFTEAVLSDTGAFGGLFDLSRVPGLGRPVLVASTDGVGTKSLVAVQLDRWDTIGQDLVNHCINDILVQGAQPLFFLDYVAASKLEPERIAAIVRGMALACQAAGCALLGGETAEMPGIYEPGGVDVVGTIVGTVERDNLIDGQRIEAGDAIVGLPSSGLHTNGYSLARHVLRDLDWTQVHPDLGTTPGEALLAVHRSYLEPVAGLRQAGVDIRGLAHITGGGVIDNLPRILPDGVSAVIQRGSWSTPPIFDLIQRLGNVPDDEMWRVFNMGMGMLVVVPPEQVAIAQATLADLALVGEIVVGDRQVEIRG